MLGYLLLVTFSSLATLIFLILAIYGFIKRKKKVAIIALSAFVVFTLISVASIYTYIVKQVDYIASDEFQAAAKKKGEGMGKTWGNTVSGAAKGLEETLDEDVISKLANITGKVVKATSAGLDTTIGQLSVITDQSVEQSGMVIGRAEKNIGASAKNIGLYIDFSKVYKGNLKLTAYDQQGSKMDVATVSINEKAGAGKMIVFDFQYLLPGVNGYCLLTAER
jgi:hypothetical protein